MQLHCTALAALLLCALAAAAPAQAPAPSTQIPATGEAILNVYVRGIQIGSERVTLSRDGSGWIIESSGRHAAPVDFTISRFEMKYGAEWQPMEMKLEGTLRGAPVGISTTFGMTTAVNDVLSNGRTIGKEDQVSARTIVMPNNVFGSYEALAARLATAAADSELPVYIAPQAEITVKIHSIVDETMTGPSGTMAARRFDLTFDNPSAPVSAAATIDGRGRLVRFEIPSVGLVVSREELAGVATRTSIVRNPTDVDVNIPANGFDLAGTLTTPRTVAGRLHYPAVVLIGRAAPADRDEVVDGIPVFAKLAQALADNGVISLRYDRRGGGQSGGRVETATLSDYADDAAAAVKWMSKRGDVDRSRLVVMGLGEGGSVALIAAGRDKEITGIITADAIGTRGADFLLREQQRVLDGMKLTDAERQARIDLQKAIQNAVIAGGSWANIPPAMRRQAETTWFHSLLLYDPAAAVARTRQPMLIVQADHDLEVPAEEAGHLADLAKARKKLPAPEVLHLPDADRALSVPSTHTLSPALVTGIVDWLKKLQ